MHDSRSDAAMFDVEYRRLVEQQHQLVCKLRAVVQEQLRLRENELGLFVDKIMNFKSIVSKTNVFHLHISIQLIFREKYRRGKCIIYRD
ncbi:bZIP transcription factor TGA10-like [Senna tora]|uniref:BZIP transcription factor TGA10-like n=1 Tax=Senna tora TaxID=362788 RepID=A0A834SNC0_9FABA|nr:bZIP transcription factor TGA10-like [Senna tora]